MDSTIVVALVTTTGLLGVGAMQIRAAAMARRQAVAQEDVAATLGPSNGSTIQTQLDSVRRELATNSIRASTEEAMHAEGRARQLRMEDAIDALTESLAVAQATMDGNREVVVDAMATAKDNAELLAESNEMMRRHSEEDMAVFEALKGRLADLYRVLGDPTDWQDGDDQAITMTEYLRDVKHKLDANTAQTLDSMHTDLLRAAHQAIAWFKEWQASHDPGNEETP